MKIFANSEAGNSADFSQELTDYAAGYKVPNVEDALEFIAPSVAVQSKRFEYAKFGDGAMYVDVDDERAPFGTFKTVQDSGEIVSAKLVSRGYTVVIDEDEFLSKAVSIFMDTNLIFASTFPAKIEPLCCAILKES